MKYQIGDDIIVLHSHEEGKVVEMINDKMVMIEVRGVKFPAYMDQIDFPYFYRFSKKKLVEEKKPKLYVDAIPKEKPTPNAIKVEEGVWISLLPKFRLDDFNDEIVDYLKVFLVNKTALAYRFDYEQLANGSSVFALQNEVLPFHDFYLHNIAFETVNDGLQLITSFSLLQPQKDKADFFEAPIKIKPKQLFNRIEALKDGNEPTISYRLFDKYPTKIYVEEPEDISLKALTDKGFKVYKASQIKNNLEQPRTVVDLHIDKITNNYKTLNNFEMLSIQLKEFEKWYDLAVAHKLPNFIIIHGVGKGKLKEEIHDVLKTKREVKHFVNQYDSRFGYGATEIFLK